MDRVRGLDRVLLALSVPLWILCFALAVGSARRDDALSSIYIEAPEQAGGHPTFAGYRPWLDSGQRPLAPGDRLIQLGDRDLRDTGPLRFWTYVTEAAGPDRHARVVFERDGTRSETRLPLGSYRALAHYLPVSAAFALAGLVTLLVSRPSRTVSALFQSFMALAVAFASSFGGSPGVTAFSMVVHLGSMALIVPLAIRLVSGFPAGAVGGPRTRWLGRIAWGFAVLGLFESSFVYGTPLSPAVGANGFFAAALLCFGVLLGLVSYNYRIAGPIGRRQLRWLFLGLYVGLALPLVAAAWSALDPRLTQLYMWSLSSAVVLPASLMVSVARFNLVDIDRLIAHAVTWNLLLVAALPAYALLDPALVATARVLELGPGAGPLLAGGLLGVGSVLSRRPLLRRVEQLLFVQRFQLEEGIQRLIDELPELRGPRELTRRAGERLDRLFDAEKTVVYGEAGPVFVPLFARGSAVAPALESDSPLIASLRKRGSEPLSLEAVARGPARGPSSLFDRAALEALGAAAVIPVRRGESLLSFLTLGPKRSGDVYTSRDLFLLTGVARAVSTELLRFDQAHLDSEARQMQQEEEALRYVPAPVVAEPGEREVSVLFTDIRGYTAFSEPRNPTEIFSAVRRYAAAVSDVARKYGGSVVEVHGDGVLIVYGAPQALPDKEAWAVRAAREIVRTAGAIAISEDASDEPLSVGVGIATGRAYVGNIEAADRLIWAVIGNTTNLAARLQALGQELGGPIVIDAATRSAALDEAADFRPCPDTPIRGLSEPTDVYVWAPEPPP